MLHNLAILTDQQPEIAGEKAEEQLNADDQRCVTLSLAQWVIILSRCYSSLATFYCLYICLLFLLFADLLLSYI